MYAFVGLPLCLQSLTRPFPILGTTVLPERELHFGNPQLIVFVLPQVEMVFARNLYWWSMCAKSFMTALHFFLYGTGS